MIRDGLDNYEEKVGAVRHKENTTKIDRLSWIVAIGVGIVVTLNATVLARLH